jgi:hypothetical protein
MTTKKQNKTSGKEQRPGKIKGRKLQKQILRDLTTEGVRTVKGGEEVMGGVRANGPIMNGL